MQVKARLNNLRVSPRKTRLVADLIKGLAVQDALIQLETTVKRSIPQMKKLLLSAINNGENNFGIDKDNMYVYNVIVGSGATLKRWMPKAYGRAGQIRKRTSKIELIIAERVEGKGRKSKEQLEKEKAERIKEKKKIEKEAAHNAEEKEKENKKQGRIETAGAEKEKKIISGGEKKGGLTSRIFRRKSM